jgi:signal transduction histidine kinase
MRKTGVIVSVFTVVIILVLVLGGAVLYVQLQDSFEDSMDGVGSVYLFTPQEVFDLVVGGGASDIDDSRLIDSEDVPGHAMSLLFSKIMYTFIFLALAIIIVMLIFWRRLLKADKLRTKDLVEGLDNLAEEPGAFFADDDPALASAYRRVQRLVDRSVSDYRRLQFYLSHEQKNDLAILRADPDLVGNEALSQVLGRLSDNIDDVLTISDTSNDTPLETVDVTLVCATACDAYKSLAEIEFDFDEDASCNIKAKERWIYRAVCNLIDNAIKYGKHSPIKVEVKNEKKTVIVSVEDHGIGIAEDELGKIFTQQYRVRELNKDGYGIGLSLVSHVVDHCGGFAYVESKKDKGSKFYLTFPAI